MRRTRNEAKDAWRFVNRQSEDDCWPWLGRTNSTGYGSFTFGGRIYSAHRVVFALANPGVITLVAPKDKRAKEFLLHRCDNKLCCNPSHLFLGNYADNNRDAHEKGRAYVGGTKSKGARHKLAKLTQEQAEEIRSRYAGLMPASQIAARYGVCEETARKVVVGKSYRV